MRCEKRDTFMMDYDEVLGVLVDWAAADPNVRAVVLTGSAAAHSQHPLSDRDLELHVCDTTALEESDDWWSSLGQVLAVERLEDGEDRPTRLIYYVGGKLDFTLVEVDSEHGVYDRPFSVLLDKDAVSARWVLVDWENAGPDQEAFDECVNGAAAAALMAAKAIVRDEPWSLVVRDSDLKAELLRMIEWDHVVRYGSARDVRFLGSRLRAWMDPDVQQRLTGCWSTFGGAAQEALLSTLDLFEETAARVAANAELSDFAYGEVHAEVDRILATASC